MQIQTTTSTTSITVTEVKQLIDQNIWKQFVEGLGTDVLNPRQQRKVDRIAKGTYKQESKAKKQAEPVTPIEKSFEAAVKQEKVKPITTKVKKVEAVSKSEVNPVVASSEDDYLNQVVDSEALKQKVNDSIAFDETNQDHKDAANTVVKTYCADHNLSGSKFTRGQVLDIVELIREAIFGPDEDDDQYDDEE